MAMPVTHEDVYRVLTPWLGTPFCTGTPTVQDVTEHLASYAPNRVTLFQLRENVESLLLVRMNRYTGYTLQVYMDNGRVRKISREVLSAITDDLMGIIFDKLTVFSANYMKLSDYSMKTQSLNAMRVLYQKYRSFFSQEEYECLIHMIRTIYPPACYQNWLKNETEQ